MEEEDHPFKQSKFDALLEEYTEVEENVEEKFRKLMKDFPDQENVRTLLKQFKSDDDTLSPGVAINLENNSNSGSSTKKDAYVKKRVISMQEEMIKKRKGNFWPNF